MNEPQDHTPRRHFLKSMSAAAAASILGTQPLSFADEEPNKTNATGAHQETRIVRLKLMTAASLSEMRAFYRDRIGFTVLAESDKEITFTAGQTTITFVRCEPDGGRPFYHFAFNIPQNKIRLARAWQLERWPLITTPPELRDPEYPDDVRHFRHWNAHSIFFWDPAGNLVEYIARHDLANEADGPFTTQDIHYASEIGFVIDDRVRLEVATTLRDAFGLSAYKTEPGGSFFAMGDERGLLLLLTHGQRRNVDPTRETIWNVFPTEAELRGGTLQSYPIEGYPYRIEAT